ncbi:AraC family transcriptional regulator [Marinicella sp. W31]|uniref:AraC family transcriptional regulator n=1 Tax=Marinicella sp. W31 TaxID=3023713 RepID=UPI003757AAB9
MTSFFLTPTRKISSNVFGDLIDSICIYSYHFDKPMLIDLDGRPEGVFELVFQKESDIWQSSVIGDDWQLRDQAFIAGLHQSSYKLRIFPDTKIISVRFKPGGFKYFNPEKQDNFSNKRICISEIWGLKGKKLIERISNEEDENTKISIIINFLHENYNGERKSIIDNLVRVIIKNDGIVDLKKLADSCNLSVTHLRKVFREEIGLSPKKFSKIIKVNSILKKVVYAKEKRDLMNLAHSFHYYDQSHFIKDFKEIVGYKPTEYCDLVRKSGY